MTRRRLTSEEIELWQRVVRTAERLRPAGESPRPAPLPRPKPKKPVHPRLADVASSSVPGSGSGPAGRLSRPVAPATAVPDPRPSPAEELARGPLAMDRRTHARMRRGKLKPEARLDLHGRRREDAHAELVRFILSSQAAGRRLVLVITGKGRASCDDGPIPTPRGVLRHQVPQWLALPPLAQAVLQVTTAHVSHGGEGAYYVYLRRRRGR